MEVNLCMSEDCTTTKFDGLSSLRDSFRLP
jgi:hypothetical protein